jgi:hypothetical protein
VNVTVPSVVVSTVVVVSSCEDSRALDSSSAILLA